MSSQESVPTTNTTAGVPLLALCSVMLVIDSMHFIWARMLLSYADPIQSSLFILVIGTTQVGLWGWWQGSLRLDVFRRHFWFFLSIGTLVAVSTVINYNAVAFIDAGTAAMLSRASILFNIIIGIVWLGDRLSRRQTVGAGLAILGAFLVTFQPGDYAMVGALMVLGSTLMYALHAVLTKRYGDDIEFVNFFFYRLFSTTTVLFLIAAANQKLSLPSLSVFWLFLLVATVDVVISRTLYYTSLRRLQISIHTIILTVSPVFSLVWAFFLFTTFPQPQQLMGGMIVLLGVFLVMFRTSAP
ncbi:MAG: DMT family transporter [Chloroflexota bacterium]